MNASCLDCGSPYTFCAAQVLVDTPYGRFAVLVPSGMAPGSPLLVPLPVSQHAEVEAAADSR
eukprot:3216946-Pleurochrysis_carterae.AAC.1